MKKISIFVLLILPGIVVMAQDIPSSLDAAESAYKTNNQLAARDNLQQVLIKLNELIGHEILNSMPSTLGGLAANSEDDNIIGGTGFAGLMVGRTYGVKNNKYIEVTIANESPMLAIVNSFLGNEMMAGIMASQTGQKRVTISGYKGLLEKSDSENNNTGYTLNVPLGDSLFTFETSGIDSETDVIILAQQVNLKEIVANLK